MPLLVGTRSNRVDRGRRAVMRPSVESLETRSLLSNMVPGPASARLLAERHLSVRPHAGAANVQSGQILRDVVYRVVPGDHEALDVFEPPGPAPPEGRPVIVAIHGGGWRKFNKNEYEPVVTPLTRFGFVVVVPNYPLSMPGDSSWPVNLEAVRDAVRWVRTHAEHIGTDPTRIAAMGESAGGHLAALLGTDPETTVNGASATVQAVVDFYGPTDLSALDAVSPAARPAIRQFLGASPSSDPARFVDASPLTHVSSGDPPTLIVQGTADRLVVPSQSSELAASLTAAGVPNRLILIPGAGHGIGLNVAGHNLSGDVARFLDQAMPRRESS